MTSATRMALLTLGAGVLTACAATPPAPVLHYARNDCAATPNLSAAISLTPDREKASHAVLTPVDGQAACLAPAGTPYFVYRLPADFGDKTITVGATLEALRIFAPDVAILDANGVVTRTFARDEYYYRSLHYSVQFRPREEEVYILVSAEPALVGQRYDSIVIGTSTTSTYANGMAFSWTGGTDDNLSRTFSYEGTIAVVVSDSDTQETGAASADDRG